ncbi:4300_t:CDS:2, partial [Funneliformis geosporum]
KRNQERAASYTNKCQELQGFDFSQAYLGGKDTLVSIKTEGGKTFCYVICALVFEGITIVINPLKALMEDQKVSNSQCCHETFLGHDLRHWDLMWDILGHSVGQSQNVWDIENVHHWPRYTLCFDLRKLNTRQK